jgi:predicted nucleic acid-binding protein
MAWLLDTSAWIVYLKSAESAIRSRLEKLTPADVFLCSVVKALRSIMQKPNLLPVNPARAVT